MMMATPTPGALMPMTPEQMQAWSWQREIDERNRPLSEEELDGMLPPGYKVRVGGVLGCLETVTKVKERGGGSGG